MTDERGPGGRTPVPEYAAVIADLHARRDRLDEAIAALEALAGEERSAGRGGRRARMARRRSEGLGARCAEVLRAHAPAKLSTRQILDRLIKDGLDGGSALPIKNVYAALAHRAFVAGDVVRTERCWQFCGARADG